MSRWILAAIDGTGSTDWRSPDGSNSHIFRFENAFNTHGGRRQYFDGPSAGRLANIFGSTDSTAILSDVQTFIANSLVELVPILHDIPVRMIVESPTWPVREAVRNADIRICLVGHSRGGAIAMKVAETLPIQVSFLGLFDAVDRAMFLLTDGIQNVDVTYHALRDPRMGSRGSFSNTGLRSTGRYYEQRFMTSHGGIGGSMDFRPTSFGQDFTCDATGLRAGIMSMMRTNLQQVCADGSRNAYEWILSRARLENLPI